MGVIPEQDELMEEFEVDGQAAASTGGTANGGGDKGKGKGKKGKGKKGKGQKKPEEAPEEGEAATVQPKKRAKYSKANGKAKAVKPGENERVFRTCAEAKPKTSFVSQRNDCEDCRLPLNNLRNMTLRFSSEENVTWFNEYVADPDNRLKLTAQCNLRCPPNTEITNGPHGAFPLMQYRKELQMEKAIIKDGIYEMMSEIAFQHWAGKPKNGGLGPAEASAKWRERYDKPGAVTDLLGENPKYAQRVAIKVKDLLVDRLAKRELEAASFLDKQVTNATEEDQKKALNRLENARLGEASELAGLGSSKMLDVAKQFAAASGDLADGGSGSELADMKRKVGDVRATMADCDKDEEAREAKTQKASSAAAAEADVDGGASGAGGEPGSGGAAKSGTGENAAEEAARPVWNQRDVQIADAVKLHEKWSGEQDESLVGLIAKAKIALQAVAASDPGIATMCCRDADILRNELHALRLVKGGAESANAAAELKTATGDQ
ncbi:unnamed protein product, partial [Prorocentrum cordatum]